MKQKFNLKRIKLIVGLGNPGGQFANTYHNAGFLCVDFLKKKTNASDPKILKSAVFMNESGNFVKNFLKKTALNPDELVVIHDDSDLELGNYKLSFGRGAAGHKGAETVIKALQTKNFWRLRIGVRKKTKIRAKAADFVLKDISRADKKILKDVFLKIGARLKQ